jgi:hypothetical protein
MAALLRRTRWTGAALALTGALMAGIAGVARADAPPVITTAPAISGTPEVGQTLTAAASWTGDPAPKVRWVWARCPPLGGACDAIAAGASPSYTITSYELGFVLAVRLELKNTAGTVMATSPPTTVVTQPAPTPEPTPTPTPTPEPTPTPTPTPTPEPTPSPTPMPTPTPTPTPSPMTTGSPTAPAATSDHSVDASSFDLVASPAPVSPASEPTRVSIKPARFPIIDPFPVIRIKGRLTASGARVTMLSVTSPRSVTVRVDCRGRCPVAHVAKNVARAAAVTRLRSFERELRGGTRLEITVTRPGYIGKSTEILIRRGRTPVRRDRCIVPGQTRPQACPER